jgi:hypothetical protein
MPIASLRLNYTKFLCIPQWYTISCPEPAVLMFDNKSFWYVEVVGTYVRTYWLSLARHLASIYCGYDLIIFH